MEDCTLLISSCDRYSDLWEPYFNLLRRNWPDCPLELVLITEEKSADIPGVRSLCLGKGLDWSTLLLKALEAVNTPNVLFTLEDFFLRKPVDTARIEGLYWQFKSDGLNMLRLTPRPGPDIKIEGKEYGAIAKDAAYRVSTQAGFWKRSVLEKILVAGESAWEFEIKGTQRAKDIEGFTTVWREAYPYRHHVVERGKWFPWDYAQFKRMNIGIDVGARAVMSNREAAKWLIKKATYETYKAIFL